MPESVSDAELVRNLTAAFDQESTQTKINRHLTRFIAVRVVLPVVAVGVVAYVANRLTQDEDQDTTDQN